MSDARRGVAGDERLLRDSGAQRAKCVALLARSRDLGQDPEYRIGVLADSRAWVLEDARGFGAAVRDERTERWWVRSGARYKLDLSADTGVLLVQCLGALPDRRAETIAAARDDLWKLIAQAQNLGCFAEWPFRFASLPLRVTAQATVFVHVPDALVIPENPVATRSLEALAMHLQALVGTDEEMRFAVFSDGARIALNRAQVVRMIALAAREATPPARRCADADGDLRAPRAARDNDEEGR